ncbi:MAG: nucleotide exchange factor GrpE [Thermoguttaceae bacterium]
MSQHPSSRPPDNPDDWPNDDPRETQDRSPGENPGADPERPDFDVEFLADDLAADLGRLQTELEEAKNRALRSSAELENFRRRANRQIEDERRYANLELLRALLPIWDNMQRAVEAARSAGETGSLLEGFRMVSSQLENVLERFHCVRIEAEGRPFDPNLHEAISQMPSADQAPGTVLVVTQLGFLLHDRVVRPCQVVVSTSPPANEPPQAAGQEGPPSAEGPNDSSVREGR